MKSIRQKNNTLAVPNVHVLEKFEQWFLKNKRKMPWRENPTPYYVWVSEIMLQQTQVKKVIPYFTRFIETFPTLKSLAEAPIEKVYLQWAGLGYYSRARNLHRAAQKIIEEQRGEFPSDKKILLDLPGIGPYTAGAILSIAFEKKEALLDGNVERFFARYYFMKEPKKHSEHLWLLAQKWVEKAADLGISPRVFNQALMEHGAVVCTPHLPNCGECVFQKKCEALVQDKVYEVPMKKTKKWVQVEECVLCLYEKKSQKILLRLNPAGAWRAGLWDLPEKSDFLKEKSAIHSLEASPAILESKHVVTHHKIKRTTEVHVWKKTPLFNEKEYAWVSLTSLRKNQSPLPLSASAARTLGLFLKRLDLL